MQSWWKALAVGPGSLLTVAVHQKERFPQGLSNSPQGEQRMGCLAWCGQHG